MEYVISKWNNKYEIIYKYSHGMQQILNTTNTKTEAINYVIKYMRSHTNG